jgi:hypothetical protein
MRISPFAAVVYQHTVATADQIAYTWSVPGMSHAPVKPGKTTTTTVTGEN